MPISILKQSLPPSKSAQSLEVEWRRLPAARAPQERLEKIASPPAAGLSRRRLHLRRAPTGRVRACFLIFLDSPTQPRYEKGFPL